MDRKPRPVDRRPWRPQTLVQSLALPKRSVGSRGIDVALCNGHFGPDEVKRSTCDGAAKGLYYGVVI